MKVKRMLPFLIFMAVVFYVLPFWIKDMSSSIIIMLTITPVLCFACSLLCGAYNSFSLWYVLLVMLLFVPAIFIYYNISAWIYIVGYGFFALAGNAIGVLLKKLIMRK